MARSDTAFELRKTALALTEVARADAAVDFTGATLAGRYRVDRTLGLGGMGVVFAVRDLRLERDAALKVLTHSLARDDAARAKFLQEARAASALSHPRVATIYDFGETDGELYIVMQLVDGTSLRELIGDRGLSCGLAVRILACVADALSAAHERGLVHRDVKPENIMVCDQRSGESMLLDFGLARAAFSDAAVGRTRPIQGTPHYMAPERFRGLCDNPLSDLYALGVVAWEMLVGRPPFQATCLEDMAKLHARQPPPAMPDAIPERLSMLVEQLLAKAPQARPGSASAVRSRLRTISADAK